MYSQKGGGGAKVPGKHLAARGATREQQAPREHDWCMGEARGRRVGGMPGRWRGDVERDAPRRRIYRLAPQGALGSRGKGARGCWGRVGLGKWEGDEQPQRAGEGRRRWCMGRVHGCMHSGGACSQVPPDAPGTAHGRGGHVRGRAAHREPVCCRRSSQGETLEERGVGVWEHLKVHSGANCAKCQNLAHEQGQQEVGGLGERGARALSNETLMSHWG